MAVNFEIETTRIEVGKNGGFFTVRGMNSEDVTFLTMHYLDDMKKVVAKYAGTGGIMPKDRVADVIMDLAKDFPMMVVEIISRCAEATSADDVDKFRRLSFVKQIEALKAIFLLTVEDGGIELGKLAGVVASLLEANGLPPGPLTKSLQTIIETSGRPSAT
jgi:hypothetical protein